MFDGPFHLQEQDLHPIFPGLLEFHGHQGPLTQVLHLAQCMGIEGTLLPVQAITNSGPMKTEHHADRVHRLFPAFLVSHHIDHLGLDGGEEAGSGEVTVGTWFGEGSGQGRTGAHAVRFVGVGGENDRIYPSCEEYLQELVVFV